MSQAENMPLARIMTKWYIAYMPHVKPPPARGTAELSQLVRSRLRQHLDALPVRPTQRAIGAAINRTQTWVSHYFSGRHDIDLNTLARLATFLCLDKVDP